MSLLDLLLMDLPAVPRAKPTVAPLSIVCSVCGSPDFWRCAPGTASTAEMYPASNVVALRADDSVPLVAFCRICDPMLVRS